MTDTKQPEALRLAETLEALGDYNFATEAAAELRRQHAEIESLRADQPQEGAIYLGVPDEEAMPTPTAMDGPGDGHVVQQFRRRDCTDWHDGHADHTDGGGPYEERTLYTTPQPAPAAEPVEAQQPGMAPATLPDERATFEAWISKDGGDLSTFGSGRNIHYSNSAVNNAWTGWKARASHWQAPAQPAPAAQDDAKDAARYRWLTDGHERPATRIVRNQLCERLPWMSYSAVSADIDAAIAASKKEPT